MVVSTAYEMGWSNIENGALLAAAEQAGFEAFITTDKNLRYQQVVSGRQLAILVLPYPSWPRLRLHVAAVTEAVDKLKPGDFVELMLA